MEPFFEFSFMIGVTVIVAIILRMLKQPLIIGYILAGVLAGPYVFDMIKAEGIITLFAHIGVALLLFIVGLNLNPKIVRDIGKVSLVTGLGQIIFTTTIGFFIAGMLGFDFVTSLYIAVALSFSSTIIIMKLLSDKGDVEKLYGRIAVGFLIVQDIVAIIILMLISNLKEGLDYQKLFGTTLLTGSLLFLSFYLIGYYVLPALTKTIAKSQELLLLFSIAWALTLSSLFYYFGFSMEIGALLAGVTLSMSPYRFEIDHKMRTLRDFFIVVFFILLGSQLTFSDIGKSAPIIMLLSGFVLIGNPIIVMILMGMMGYSKRNSFLAGLTVAQISEFSLIVVALGISVGHIGSETLSLVTSVGLITIAGSSYMILYSDKLYSALARYLSIFERKKRVDQHKYHNLNKYDVVLFGYNSIGHDLAKSFDQMKKKYIIIDYNPETVVSLAKQGIECRYGDVNDPELLQEIDFSRAKMVISTISHFDTNILLVNKIREINKKLIIMTVAEDIDEAMELYSGGATYVIMPHFIGGNHASVLIEKHKFDANRFMKEQIKHIKYLNTKKDIVRHH